MRLRGPLAALGAAVGAQVLVVCARKPPAVLPLRRGRRSAWSIER